MAGVRCNVCHKLCVSKSAKVMTSGFEMGSRCDNNVCRVKRLLRWNQAHGAVLIFGEASLENFSDVRSNLGALEPRLDVSKGLW